MALTCLNDFQTLTDGRSQVRHAAALAVGTVTWLRDEEANASAEN